MGEPVGAPPIGMAAQPPRTTKTAAPPPGLSRPKMPPGMIEIIEPTFPPYSNNASAEPPVAASYEPAKQRTGPMPAVGRGMSLNMATDQMRRSGQSAARMAPASAVSKPPPTHGTTNTLLAGVHMGELFLYCSWCASPIRLTNRAVMQAELMQRR